MFESSDEDSYGFEFIVDLPQSNKKQKDDLTMDEVEDALRQIDQKYSKYHDQNGCDKNLIMLLQDFDSLGLPEIDQSLPSKDINRKIVSNSKLLVEMYRRNLCKLNDDELNFRSKDTKYSDLQKKLTTLQNNYDKLVYKNNSLEAVIERMKSENGRINEILLSQKNEMKKLKTYYSSKQNEMQHSLKKLEKNNQDLKNMCGQDIGKYIAKDEVVANYVKKHKLNEQIYQSTIKQLQENNNRLLEELTKFRED